MHFKKDNTKVFVYQIKETKEKEERRERLWCIRYIYIYIIVTQFFKKLTLLNYFFYFGKSNFC